MDNATKALRIAGAVLLGLLVTSLLIFAHNTWQKHQKANIESTQKQQVTKFNGALDVYNKKALRGSDMVSLGNKLNSINREYAGEPVYNMYDKTVAERRNMEYRYSETDLMPVRAFVAFCKSSSDYDNFSTTPTPPGSVSYQTLYSGANIENYKSSDFVKFFPQDKTATYIDLDEYIQKIYNDGEVIKYGKEHGGEGEIKKVFKGYYFECVKVDFDNRNGRYCRLFFRQVIKLN